MKPMLGVALFGSLIASSFVSGLHVALAISIGLMVAIGGLTLLLGRPGEAKAD